MPTLFARKPIGTIAYMGGVPSVLEPFAWSFAQMVQYNTEYMCEDGQYVHYNRATFSYHSAARNMLAHQIHGDWLLMLDTDHQFDPDICARLVRLMYLHDLDVITGIYMHKNAPHTPVLYLWNDKVDGFSPIGDWDKSLQLLRIDSAGAGCLLIRKRVFERIRKELKQEPFDIIMPYGEDHSFFYRLRALGIKAWCALDIECHHLALTPLKIKDYTLDDISLSPKTTVQGFQHKQCL